MARFPFYNSSFSLSPLFELNGEIGCFLFSSCSWIASPFLQDFAKPYLHFSHTARLSPSKGSSPTSDNCLKPKFTNSPTLFGCLTRLAFPATKNNSVEIAYISYKNLRHTFIKSAEKIDGRVLVPSPYV